MRRSSISYRAFVHTRSRSRVRPCRYHTSREIARAPPQQTDHRRDRSGKADNGVYDAMLDQQRG